jgi:hypothetical protein
MKIFIPVLLAALLGSCKPTVQQPENLIPRNVMEKVMLDVNLAESYSNMVKDSLHQAGTKNPDSLTLYYKDIFNHYKITAGQFNTSLNWYKAHPDLLDSMYNNMVPVVTRLQTKAAVPPPVPVPSNVPAVKK